MSMRCSFCSCSWTDSASRRMISWSSLSWSSAIPGSVSGSSICRSGIMAAIPESKCTLLTLLALDPSSSEVDAARSCGVSGGSKCRPRRRLRASGELEEGTAVYESIAAQISCVVNKGPSAGVTSATCWLSRISFSAAAASFAMRSSGVEVKSICIASVAGVEGV